MLSPHAIGRLRFEGVSVGAGEAALGARRRLSDRNAHARSVPAECRRVRDRHGPRGAGCRLRSRAHASHLRPSAPRLPGGFASPRRGRLPRRGCARACIPGGRRRTMLVSADPALAAMSKLLATEIAQEAVDIAIQVHGAVALEHGHHPGTPLQGGSRTTDLRGRLRDPARDHRPFAVQIRRGPQGGRLDRGLRRVPTGFRRRLARVTG